MSILLEWDFGTAYDLFVSLDVLHHPAEFDLPGPWAAGMRARLPAKARGLLEKVKDIVKTPLDWIYSLDEPKDSLVVLEALERIPARERLKVLTSNMQMIPGASEILNHVTESGKWTEEERDRLLETYRKFNQEKAQHLTKEILENQLEICAKSEEFGQLYLEAIQAYVEIFFAEEERRIRPFLTSALDRARRLAEKLPLLDLIEELSQGVRVKLEPGVDKATLAPSYWCTPLLYIWEVKKGHPIFLFGARPPEVSLVPGETVPEALLRTLKALSDSTRLRMLRYLSEKPQSPAELARHLRLRTPTVIHHLKALRLAGLIQVILEENEEAKRYSARKEAIEAAFSILGGFLKQG